MFIKRGDGKIISIIKEEDLQSDIKGIAEIISSKKELNRKSDKKTSDPENTNS